jgi:hypothetical protein
LGLGAKRVTVRSAVDGRGSDMARMGRRFPLRNKCIRKDTIAKNAKRRPRRVADVKTRRDAVTSRCKGFIVFKTISWPLERTGRTWISAAASA